MQLHKGIFERRPADWVQQAQLDLTGALATFKPEICSLSGFCDQAGLGWFFYEEDGLGDMRGAIFAIPSGRTFYIEEVAGQELPAALYAQYGLPGELSDAFEAFKAACGATDDDFEWISELILYHRDLQRTLASIGIPPGPS